MNSTPESAPNTLRLFPVVLGILALALSGCADTAAESDAQPGDSEVSAPVDSGSGVSGTAELGTIAVDTATYDVLEALNCQPVQSSDLVVEVFDVIAIAESSDGDSVLFFAYTQEQSGVTSNFIDYQGPEGTWSTQEGNASFTLDGGILSGMSELVDDAATRSITVDFAFAVPNELVDCD
jgi:hypothetical protein